MLLSLSEPLSSNSSTCFSFIKNQFSSKTPTHFTKPKFRADCKPLVLTSAPARHLLLVKDRVTEDSIHLSFHVASLFSVEAFLFWAVSLLKVLNFLERHVTSRCRPMGAVLFEQVIGQSFPSIQILCNKQSRASWRLFFHKWLILH